MDTLATSPSRVTTEQLDCALAAQLIVGWAGEKGDGAGRLGWWDSDLTGTYGGETVFQDLLPLTWPWATLQAAREAARRTDAAQRSHDADPDRIVSLFHFGFELDELIEERLQALKRRGGEPAAALPELACVIADEWEPQRFATWVQGHAPGNVTSAPIGRRLTGAAPESLAERVDRLVAALLPADNYPLPHFRSGT